MSTPAAYVLPQRWIDRLGAGAVYAERRVSLFFLFGFSSGLPLALSNRGHVLIGERQCPVLGRVSMDYTTVDLTQVPDAVVGDEVTCLGGRGPGSVSADDWAQIKGTHAYDIICSFGSRVERCFVGESDEGKI